MPISKRSMELMNRFFETVSYDEEPDWRKVSLPDEDLEEAEGEGGQGSDVYTAGTKEKK